MIAGTAGSLLGTLPWYWAGRVIGLERLQRWADSHGRWMAVSRQDLDAAEAWFKRRGPLAVVLGRLVPAVRSVISAPAGMARMPMAKFLFWSGLGSLAWTGLLAAGGYVLEARYELLVRWLDPLAQAVLAVAVIAYLWRVVTFKKRLQKQSRGRRTDRETKAAPASPRIGSLAEEASKERT